MKIFKFLAVLCLAGLCFASCGEKAGDEEDEEFVNGVIYNGVSYDIVHSAGMYMDQVGELGNKPGYRFSFYIGSDACHCFPRLSASCKGKVIDLSKHTPSVAYSFGINDNEYVIDVHQTNDAEEIYGILDRGKRQDNPIFKSGSTMKIDEVDGDIIFIVDAVTINNKDLKIKLKFKPNSEF